MNLERNWNETGKILEKLRSKKTKPYDVELSGLLERDAFH